MIPTSTGTTNPCDPISSNCVIWQGPDLPCIDLCNGDTISDVIAKLAQELCDIIDAACQCEPDLSGVAVECFYEPIVPPGGLSLEVLLQAMIDHMCSITPTPVEDLLADLPACLVAPGAVIPGGTVNPATGLVQLPIVDYAEYLANTICSFLDAITQINVTLANYETRISVLETQIQVLNDCVLPCQHPHMITPQCVLPSTSQVTIEQLLLAVELSFCNLRAATGNESQISQAISGTHICVTGNTPLLSGLAGTYGQLTGWTDGSNLAYSHQNLWIVVCDMIGAITSIQDNCCSSNCDGIDYTIATDFTTDPSTGDVISIDFNFTQMDLPTGFIDCPGGAEITVEDVNGQQYTRSTQVAPFLNSVTPYSWDFAGSGLLTSGSYTVTINFCFTNGTLQCENTVVFSISSGLLCPSDLTLTPTPTGVDYTFSNTLSGSPTYVIYTYDSVGNQTSINSLGTPPLSVSGNIALSIGTYTFVIEISNTAGQTTTCPGVSFTVAGVACTSEEMLVSGPSFVSTGNVGAFTIGTQVNTNLKTEYSLLEDASGDITVQYKETALVTPDEQTPDGTFLTMSDGEGTVHGLTEISCSGSPYAAAASNSWYFIDSYTNVNNITYFVYASWDSTGASPGISSVLVCCECPVMITDEWTNEIGKGETFLFEPTIIEFSPAACPGGIVTYSVVPGTGPASGTVLNNNDGTFLYSYTGPDTMTDGFQVQVEVTNCPDCNGTATAWMSLQIAGTSGGRIQEDTNVYTFIDVQTISAADAAKIKATMDQVKTDLVAACPAYTGNFYTIMATGDFAKRWLGQQKAVVDQGASATLSVDVAYTVNQNLPPSWAGGPPSDITNVILFTFCDDTSTVYNPTTLGSGWTGSPTTGILNDYDDYRDALDGTILGTSGWAAAFGIVGPVYEKFQQYLMPVSQGGGSLTGGAEKLHIIAAIEAIRVPENRWQGWRTGASDLDGYLLLGTAPLPNPFEGVVTGAGHTWQPLGEIGFNADLRWDVATFPGYDSADEFQKKIEQVMLGKDVTSCPDAAVSTGIYELSPCPAYVANPNVYTSTDLSVYDVGERAINVDGVCYGVREVESTDQPIVGVVVTADSWSGGTGCAVCSNFLATNCTDPGDTLITAQNLSAYVGAGSVYLVGAGPIKGCYVITVTNSAPTYTNTLTINETCTECIDCLSHVLGVNEAIGHWDLQDSNVWADNGITAATDGGILARIDNLNGTCGVPTTPVLGNALNLTALNTYTYETDGIVGKGPDGNTGAAISYLDIANDATFDGGTCSIYVAFAPSLGAGAQDHIWSLTANSALTSGLGLMWDGTNFVAWGNDEANAAYKITSIATPTIDDINIVCVRSVPGALFMNWNTNPTQTVAVPWVNPSASLVLGGTRDAVGVFPAVNTAPGRIYDVQYYDQAHSDVNVAAIIAGIRNKFGV